MRSRERTNDFFLRRIVNLIGRILLLPTVFQYGNRDIRASRNRKRAFVTKFMLNLNNHHQRRYNFSVDYLNSKFKREDLCCSITINICTVMYLRFGEMTRNSCSRNLFYSGIRFSLLYLCIF